MKHFVVFGAGLLFALGLGLSGMTQPQKVIAFLDFTGAWDPALAFVMVGAIGVNMALFKLILRRGRPAYAPGFVLPRGDALDARLFLGASLFGLGWGFSGFCPGPAIASVVTGAAPVLVFVVAMAIGVLLHDLVLLRGFTAEGIVTEG